MSASRILRLGALALFAAASEMRAQDFIEQLDQHLTLSAFHDQLRARVSGTLDLEFYAFDLPPPGLIDATSEALFNPRLTLFLDSQIGPALYFFAQARFDRHFDPSDLGAQARLDEYALRFTPWEDGRVSVQIGKFATVVGRWVQRHLSWDNPFLNAPLIYENITAIEDRAAPASRYLDSELTDEKYEYNPVVWGPSYTSGASVAGQLGKFDYAVELKNASLSSRPESWDATRVGFSHPTVSGRLGFRPSEAWNFGISASSGPYFQSLAAPTLPAGRDRRDYREMLLAQDVSWEWHHIQIWAEFHEARFEIPLTGDADVFGYFLEAKYKFTPQFFAALRWNQQFFGNVSDGFGGEKPWGHDAWRADAAVAYRFTPHLQLKLQYDLEHGDTARGGFGHLFGAQFTVRF